MKHWKDMPAFFNPKGIRRNSKRPNGVMIAVFFTSEGWTGIWWKPFFRLSLLKMEAPARLLVMSAMLGRG